MEIKLSIIYVLYQNNKELQASIATLREKIKDDETEIIIVVNDGSNVNTELGSGKIIRTSENLGFASACNLGAREASGKILWFLNPDTEIISDNLENILNLFDGDKLVGIIGPQLMEADGKIQVWGVGCQPSLWDLVRNNVGFPRSRKIWMSNKIQEADWVSGASLFIKRESFNKLAGFDENFFMYFEDIDLGKRAREAGYKVMYFPDFKVRHLGGKSFEDNQLQKKYYYTSQDYYFEKHWGKIQSILIKLLRKLFA